MLLQRLERIRARTGESRSAVIARALVLLTDAEARNERLRRSLEAYREQPESAADEQAARTAARRSLAHLEWDDR